MRECVAACRDIIGLLSSVSSGIVLDKNLWWWDGKTNWYWPAWVFLVTLRLHIGCPDHLNWPHTYIYHDEIASIHLVLCRYAYCGRSSVIWSQETSRMLFSLTGAGGVHIGKGRLLVRSVSLLFRRRVMWLEPCDLHERKPRCVQEIIRATQAGFRRMQIFSNHLKHTQTHTRRMPPHHHPYPPHTRYTFNHNIYPHEHHTTEEQKKKKKQLPAPWQNSPQVHLHKTLSLTKWLHLTSWVGGRTLPVAASYLRIPQSFSRQATVSWPPL